MMDPSIDLSHQPSRPELAGLFARVPDRSARLTGVLPHINAEDQHTARIDQSTEEDRDEHRSMAQASQDRSSADFTTEAKIVGVAVYLPDELVALMRRTARTRDMTYGALALEAVRVHQAELATAFRNEPLSPSPDDLFVPIPPRHRRGPGGRQVQLRLPRAHADKLQELTHRWGAGTRSALVAEAIRLHLAQRS